jgi:hypothetical protein
MSSARSRRTLNGQPVAESAITTTTGTFDSHRQVVLINLISTTWHCRRLLHLLATSLS